MSKLYADFCCPLCGQKHHKKELKSVRGSTAAFGFGANCSCGAVINMYADRGTSTFASQRRTLASHRLFLRRKMMSNDFKPCPLCGGEVRESTGFSSSKEGHQAHLFVTCPSCSLSMKSDSRKGAIRKWNEREDKYYEAMWGALSFNLWMDVNEGISCGFDQETGTEQAYLFKAYQNVFNRMELLEDRSQEGDEDESHKS